MTFEKRFFLPNTPFLLVATDEAGRGPLAGPVVAGAVGLRVENADEAQKILRKLRRRGVNDSKKLSAMERVSVLEVFQWDMEAAVLSAQILKDNLIASWAQADSQEIDRINILQASLLSMRAAAEVVAKMEKLPVVWLIDGNKAPAEVAPEWSVHPVVDGDAKSCLIGLASVIAKVKRDRIMHEYDILHPQYGFRNHVGYPTPQHVAALLKHGPLPWHRRSFKTVKEQLTRQEA